MPNTEGTVNIVERRKAESEKRKEETEGDWKVSPFMQRQGCPKARGPMDAQRRLRGCRGRGTRCEDFWRTRKTKAKRRFPPVLLRKSTIIHLQRISVCQQAF